MVTIPENYVPSLGLYETQKAIGLIKNIFLVKICAALHLKRVTAPALTHRSCIPSRSGSVSLCTITASSSETVL